MTRSGSSERTGGRFKAFWESRALERAAARAGSTEQTTPAEPPGSAPEPEREPELPTGGSVGLRSWPPAPLLTGLLAVLAGVAVLLAPSVLAVTGGLLLAFVVPGIALVGALFTGRPLSRVEWIVLAPALNLALLVLGGLVLNAAGVRLERVSWVALTSGVTLLAVVLWAVRTGRPLAAAASPPVGGAGLAHSGTGTGTDSGSGSGSVAAITDGGAGPRRAELARAGMRLLALVVAGLVLAGAGWLSLDSARNSDAAVTTALSIKLISSATPRPAASAAGSAPSSGASAATGSTVERMVVVRLDGFDDSAAPYRVEVTGVGDFRATLNVRDTGREWSQRLEVPSFGRVTAELYRAGDAAPFRMVFVDPV